MCVIAAFPARTGCLAPNALARQGPAAAAGGRTGFSCLSSLFPIAAAPSGPGRDALRGARRAAPLHRRRLAWRRSPLLDPFAVPARLAWGRRPAASPCGERGLGRSWGPDGCPGRLHILTTITYYVINVWLRSHIIYVIPIITIFNVSCATGDARGA